MKVKLHIFLVLGFLLPIGLTGCSGGGAKLLLEEKKSSLTAKGFPPSYIAGYMDGCSSGKRIGGDKHYEYRRDNERANRDALYARGWQEGQINCRNEAIAEAQVCDKNQNYEYSSLDEERNRRVAQESRAAEAEMREIWEELRK